MPFFFALWSVFLGQDRSFDLASYHYYNAYSFLHKKFDIDFAVAVIQSYFNPLLDVPYYFLNQHFTPPLIGFLFGFFHGLIFLLIYQIAESILFFGQYNKKNEVNYLVFFVAFAGCLTPNFLAGIGNNMGDNTTAVINLISLCLIIKKWHLFKKFNTQSFFWLSLSGLIIGFSVGLKLTNAPFALSMALALFFLPIQLFIKFRFFLVFSLFVVLGILISGGFWFLNLWQHFGNPFFPLLSDIFPNNFSNINTLTNIWTPKNIETFLFFPFFKFFGYHMPGDSLARELLWPVLYILLFWGGFLRVKRNFFFKFNTRLAKENFLIFFIISSYILWMLIFGVQRYLVTIEILLPLAIFFLVNRLKLNSSIKKNIFHLLILASVLITLLGGFGTFGHTRWISPAIFAEKPIVEVPKDSIVFMSDNSPISWLVTLFPSELSFFRLNTFDFKSTKLTLDNALIKKPHYRYAMFSGFYNWRVDNVEKWDNFLSYLNLKNTLTRCIFLDHFIKKIKFRGVVIYTNKDNEMCTLSILDKDYFDPILAKNNLIKNNKSELRKFNLILDENSCQDYNARLGTQKWNYIWCKVSR